METSHKPDVTQKKSPRSETEREGLFSYHTLSDKERKSLMILELIRKEGPISRSDISKITSINVVSISNYIKDYIDKKLILEKGIDVSSGGRPPELVELNSKGLYIIGVDIGSQELIAVMTDLTMNVVEKRKMPTSKGDTEELTTKLINLIRELMTASKIEIGKIKAIGIGVSGTSFLPVKRMIEKEFDIEAFIGSDAACAAFGEKRLNPAADVEDLLYMYSDVGCGIIIRGDIYFGTGESTGEIRDSQYLKPWSDDLSITQVAKREIEKGIGTKMVALARGEINNVTKEVVIEAARQNDDVALDIIKNAGMNLGIRIAYLVNLFNPEVIVIGGGIEKAGELFLDPVRRMVKKFALSERANMVKIIPSALGEDAVTLGAVALGMREIFLKA